MSSPPQFNDYIGTSPPGSPALNGKIMSAAIAVFFLFVLIILMIHLYARLCLSYSPSGRGLAFTPTRHTHIHTGLDKAVIAQLPTFIYKAPSSAADEGDSSPPPPLPLPLPLPLECAVCLSEFQDSDKCTTLPSCKHTFHTECIDMWFFSHSTCPLCRTSVIPASTAASPSPMPSSYEQHQGGEHQVAIQASQNTAEGNHGASSPVQYPCNVLFWGNQAQVTSSQDPSSASSPSSLPSLTPAATRSLPQITIDIPPTEGNFGASAPGSLLSNSTTEQAAGSSQAPKSPGLSASLKRMLSRQSSRHRRSNEEGNEKLSK